MFILSVDRFSESYSGRVDRLASRLLDRTLIPPLVAEEIARLWAV